MSTQPAHLTQDYIVADGAREGDPIELWVDWIAGVDHNRGQRSGIGYWEGDDLIVAGSPRARRFVGLKEELRGEIKMGGAVVVAAMVSGEISRMPFPGTQTITELDVQLIC
jgi:hypothetical protein